MIYFVGKSISILKFYFVGKNCQVQILLREKNHNLPKTYRGSRF